jgi:aryl-alcohol dehydrogenase-like predicted oxidoreductase
MEYRTLGNTGTVVSTLCLGTMTFGAESDERVAHEQLDRFLEQGGNFIDTADVYSDGESEKIIGRWLGSRPGARDRVVVATKARFPRGDGPNDIGLSRVSLTRALDASLRRLGVDAIDLYQAHAWDPLTPIEETLQFFDDAVRVGKVQYVGVSNFIGWQLQKAALLTRQLVLAPIVTLQPQYNLLQRGVEFELTQVCVNKHIGILPWSPLGGGWLSTAGFRLPGPLPEGRQGPTPPEPTERGDLPRLRATVPGMSRQVRSRIAATARAAVSGSVPRRSSSSPGRAPVSQRVAKPWTSDHAATPTRAGSGPSRRSVTVSIPLASAASARPRARCTVGSSAW